MQNVNCFLSTSSKVHKTWNSVRCLVNIQNTSRLQRPLIQFLPILWSNKENACNNIVLKHVQSLLAWSWLQSFQPPYHFIVLPRAFHSIFFHLIVFFIEKNVFALVLKIAYSNTRTQAHSQAVALLVVVLQVRKILLSSNTSSKANYGLCAETGKTAAAMTNLSGFTKSTEFWQS